MRKKVYFNLIREYNSIILQKETDEQSYNNNRLSEIKMLLCYELEKTQRACGIEVMTAAQNDSPKGLAYVYKIQKVERLCEKILNEESVDVVDYDDTFYEYKIAGLTVPQVYMILSFVMVAVAIYLIIL